MFKWTIYILNSGKSDQEKVILILHKHGIKLNKANYVFFSIEVIYFEFQIINTEFLLNAKSPENVTQLKSFLRMINFYQTHLPNLASVLEPLHNLLRKMLSEGGVEKKETVLKKLKNFCVPQNYDYYL